MTSPAPPARRRRIASIDWMRGIVMILMVVDHASMAFNGAHLGHDSALYPDATNLPVSGFAFLTRWTTHLCAPTFVLLAGTALAISMERRLQKGADPKQVDRGILIRGAIIALLDPTLISLGSGRWTFQVLFAIGVSMMLMVPLRRLSSRALLLLALVWMVGGELLTGLVWHPPGSSSVSAALTVAVLGEKTLVIKYAVFPWLSMMLVGWVLGRYVNTWMAGGGEGRTRPRRLLLYVGILSLAVFVVFRGLNGYGNMFLPRADDSWMQWLHVSKYPPSLTFMALELGILCLALSFLAWLEPHVRVRENGPLLVFGQTAMFFYLVHRLVLEVPATWFGLRGAGSIGTAYLVSAVLLVLLYPACLWYRGFKKRHPTSWLRYF